MRRLLEPAKHSMRSGSDCCANRFAPARNPSSRAGHRPFSSNVLILRLVSDLTPTTGSVQMTERPEIVIPSEPRPVASVVVRDDETDPFQVSPDGGVTPS